MNIKETNEILFSQAKALKMCDAVHKAWYGKSFNVDELADLMYRNLDFCIDYRWPSKETLKNLIDAKDRRRNGVLVDDTWSLLNPTFATILGESNAKARYNGFCVGQIYVFDDSNCDITVKGHAHVIIHLYDNAKVNVTAESGTHVLLLKNSASCKSTCCGQITIKECFSSYL